MCKVKAFTDGSIDQNTLSLESTLNRNKPAETPIRFWSSNPVQTCNETNTDAWIQTASNKMNGDFFSVRVVSNIFPEATEHT